MAGQPCQHKSPHHCHPPRKPHLVIDDGDSPTETQLKQLALPAKVIPAEDRVVVLVNEGLGAPFLGRL